MGEVDGVEVAHTVKALEDEGAGEGVAGSENGGAAVGELVEVALDEDGGEAAKGDDAGAGEDGAGGGGADAGEIVAEVCGVEAVGRDEGIDVEAVGLVAQDGAGADMADGAGGDPREDFGNLVVGDGWVRGTAKDGDDIGGGAPAFLVTDEGEVRGHGLDGELGDPGEGRFPGDAERVEGFEVEAEGCAAKFAGGEADLGEHGLDAGTMAEFASGRPHPCERASRRGWS